MSWLGFGLISAFFSALAAITQKKVLRVNSALHFTAVLSIFNLLLLIPIPIFFPLTSIGSVTLLVIVIKSVLSGAAFLMVMQGIKRAEITSALPLLILTPGVVALLAFVFLGESLSSYDLAGIALLVIGTALLQYRSRDVVALIHLKNRRGIFFIVIALMLFSLTAVLDRAILNNYKVPAVDFWFYQHIILCLFFNLVAIGIKREVKQLLLVGKRAWRLILLISVFTLIYRYTFILTVKAAPAVALALSLKRVSVLFVIVLGGNYFKEKSLVKKTVGTLILLTGAWLLVVRAGV